MPPVCPGNGRNGPRVAESRDRILIAKWLGLRSCVTVPEAGGNSSVVEHDLAKVGVAGSNPVSRSNNYDDNTSSRVDAFRAA